MKDPLYFSLKKKKKKKSFGKTESQLSDLLDSVKGVEENWMPWADCVDAQAGLGLHCSHAAGNLFFNSATQVLNYAVNLHYNDSICSKKCYYYNAFAVVKNP